MRKLTLLVAAAAISTIALTQIASAADLGQPVYKAPPPPPPPVYSWTGWYVGVNAGGHWDHVNDPAFFTSNTWFGVPTDTATAAATWPNSRNSSGFAGGGQLGYNWQVPSSNFVLGFEADIDGLTGSASRNVAFPIGGPPNQSFVGDSARDNWVATLRARAGLIFYQTLLYATGGAAWSNWSTSHSYSDTVGARPVNITNSSTRSGWTVGGGLEYALFNNWTLRAEYLYADFGTINSVTLATGAGTIGFSVLHPPEKLTENIARVGLNYQFH